jgi:hypothetical protein
VTEIIVSVYDCYCTFTHVVAAKTTIKDCASFEVIDKLASTTSRSDALSFPLLYYHYHSWLEIKIASVMGCRTSCRSLPVNVPSAAWATASKGLSLWFANYYSTGASTYNLARIDA